MEGECSYNGNNFFCSRITIGNEEIFLSPNGKENFTFTAWMEEKDNNIQINIIQAFFFLLIVILCLLSCSVDYKQRLPIIRNRLD